jgi:hypothetical protein
MANELLPSVGMSGQWKLKAPFDSKIVANLAYTCRAVRKLGEVIAAGIDAFEEYYVPNSIGRDVYDQHVASDVSIIVMSSSSGSWLNVPSPYLDGWPDANVVPYVVVGMVADIGALPNTIDPTFLSEKVRNTIKNALGHDPVIQFVALSEVSNMPFAEHEALEVLRKSNITDDNTDYSRRLKAEDELVKARAEIAALQKFIIDSGIPVPVVPA